MKFTDILRADIVIKNILVDINSNSRAIKYKKNKIDQIQFNRSR